MKGSYILKKKLSAVGFLLAVLLIRGSYRLYKLLFAKRTLLFVTNQKIRSITVGPISQALLTLFVLWMGSIFMQSLRYDGIISVKSEEIDRLKSVNRFFEDEFNDVNSKLKKINEYLASVTGGSVKPVEATQDNFVKPKDFEEKNLSKDDKRTFNHIREASVQLVNVQYMTRSRIKKIEEAILVTGLNIKKIPSSKLRNISPANNVKEVSLNDADSLAAAGMGGPLEGDDHSVDAEIPFADDDIERRLQKVKFSSEIDYLMVLERLVTVMPFSKPMKNYYISSGFGARTDPITRRKAVHKGLDFVGTTKEKIISPSDGKIVLAGKFSDYGNAIVIDHGFGVTTRYGHLYEVMVKEGQMVKRGDIIAVQGNTGRSTGPHLHYEVRYKNAPLNPRRFLEAGEFIFNQETGSKHVDS